MESYIASIIRRLLNGEITQDEAVVYLQRREDELRQQLEQPIQDKRDAELKELRVKKFAKFSNEDCWLYQGDESDNLQTLTCPVVISPEKLIELQATIAQQAEAIKAAKVFAENIWQYQDDERLGEEIIKIRALLAKPNP